jgi:hypothetical protein
MPRTAAFTHPSLRNTLAATALVFSFATATNAFAQTNEQRDQAKQISTEGGKLMQQGKLPQAVDAFRKAYSIFPNPRYQYNIGVALKNLGKDAESLTAFDVFLAEAKDVPPEFLADAKRQRDSLADHVARIEVVCAEPGATVLINGKTIATTPLLNGFYLDLGKHTVRVEKAGFVSFEQTITLKVASNTRIEVVLPAVAKQAPVVAPTVTSTITTAAVPAPKPEPETASAPDAPGPLELAVSAGINSWLAGAPDGAGATVAFGGAAAYRVWQQDAVSFSLGADGFVSFMTENDKRITFTSLLASPTLRYFVLPNQLSLFARVGLGLVIVSGLEANSSLLSPGSTGVTGSLSSFEARPTVGGEYSFTQNVGLFLNAGMAYSPKPDPQFQESSFMRLAIASGLSLHF